LNILAWLLYDDEQLDTAEDVVIRAIDILSAKGGEYNICISHFILGKIYHSRGDREKAISHFQVALGIASTFNLHTVLFWGHFYIGGIFGDNLLDSARAHIEQAQLYAADCSYYLGRATLMHARVCYQQANLEEAKSEILRAIEILENAGSPGLLQECRTFLQRIELRMGRQSTPGELRPDGELL
jgi:tetratricopeptide (TPR) repeat protein